MAKRKALILYGSLTGNTEMVGQAFADVCAEYGIEADMVKIDPKRDWDANPVHIQDYDIVALGSLVIAGLPYKEVSMVMGKQGTRSLEGSMKKAGAPGGSGGPDGPNGPGGTPGVPALYAGGRAGIPGIADPGIGSGIAGAKGDWQKTIYGVVFATYGGSGVGPEEVLGTLEVEVELLRVNGVRTVGKFACPGKELRHASVDSLASKFNINIDEAQALMQRYKDNPKSEEFRKYNLSQMTELKSLASVRDEDSHGPGMKIMADNDPLECGKPGCLMWHYDFENRPNDRDITKAKIFMAEIIEDYFLTYSGDPRPPYSTYITIS